MRIGIDASTWHNGRGFGRFTREIVSAMLALESRHEFVLFFDRETPCEHAQTVVVAQSRPVTEAAVADGSRRPADLLRFTRAAARQRLDVLFYPAVYSWFPCPPGTPNLVTLHDAIAEHYPDLVFPQRRTRLLWSIKMALARMQATRFLTVSRAAREEIVAHMRIDPGLIDLTTEGPKEVFHPPASAPDAARARERVSHELRLPDGARYFVFVGGFAPHKNVLGLVHGFAALAPSAADVHLLLVGDLGSHGFHGNLEELRHAIASHGLTARVHFTGFVTDEVLAEIYGGAIALVLPSFSEGFGLPAIEAMACGTPVVASNRGALPEIVADAGLLVDPADRAALQAALGSLIEDGRLRADLQQRALARAGRFSWSLAAHLALQALERCGKRSA